MLKKIPKRFPTLIQDQINIVLTRMIDRQVHVVIEFGGRIDERQMSQALRCLVDLEPVLGCRIKEDPRKPFWERREDLDSVQLCKVIETSNVDESLQRFVGEEKDPFHDPLILAAIFRNHSDTLALKVNHTVADGGGVKAILYLLSEIYQRLGNGTIDALSPNIRGNRSLRQAFFGADIKAMRRRLRIYPEPAPPFGFPFRETDLKKRRLTTRLIQPETFRAMKLWAREHKATMNDLLLAAFYQSLFKIVRPNPTIPITVKVPCDLRALTKRKRAGAVCNLSSQYFPAIQWEHCHNLEETVEQVKKAMNAFKAEGPAIGPGALIDGTIFQPPFEKLKGFMEHIYESADASEWALPVLTNIGILETEHVQFGDLPIINTYIASPVAFPPNFIVGASGFRETLTLSSGYCMEKEGDSAVETFLDEMVGILVQSFKVPS